MHTILPKIKKIKKSGVSPFGETPFVFIKLEPHDIYKIHKRYGYYREGVRN